MWPRIMKVSIGYDLTQPKKISCLVEIFNICRT